MVYPEAKKGSIAISAGMLYRFVHEVQEGDYVGFRIKMSCRLALLSRSRARMEISKRLYPVLKRYYEQRNYGLFVTLANYTQTAQKCLGNIPIIRGINGTELEDLVLKYLRPAQCQIPQNDSPENGIHSRSARGIKMAFNEMTSVSADNLTYYIKVCRMCKGGEPW